MNLERFKKDIELELEIKILNTDTPTPILDRLQSHLDTLENKFDLYSQMLNPKNLDSEMYLSMLYRIIYPVKYKKTFYIRYNNKHIKGKDNTQILVNLLNSLNPLYLKNSKYIYNSLPKKFPKNVLPSSYKLLSNGKYFDRSFGGKGINNYILHFIKNLNEKFNLNIEFHYKEVAV